MPRKDKIVIVDTGSDFTARLQQALDHLNVSKTLLVFDNTPEAVSYILNDSRNIFCLVSRSEGHDPEGLSRYATSVILTGSDFVPQAYAQAGVLPLDPGMHEFALIERFPSASESLFEAVVAYWQSVSVNTTMKQLTAL
ncbi:hypothetical protein [Dyadobacter sandarakinus]|uniref:Uncharacterized protein n=1 Tax=Dyadobacter sandarakinus TaxID=2747268 RepID=A0ABX7I3J3_9BACT|nr:hypothetical protein [Dyadobacter sandarakinus]QRR00631.1 hypothetical protein HWI92_06770 [Dyadobacter sandarakinus]